MPPDQKFDRRIAGVKAKRLQQLDDVDSKLARRDQEVVPTVLIISPMHRRISLLFEDMLKRAGKHLQCTGVELYRQALGRLNSDLSKHVVVLVITDQSDDCYAASRSECPLWQEAIAEFQKNYHESWIKEIGDAIFPVNLTVVSYFKSLKGKMSDEDIARIEQEFESYQNEIGFKHHLCESEEEVKNMVDKDIVGMVLQRQQMQNKLKKYTRTRDQKIARAQKATRDAQKKI